MLPERVAGSDERLEAVAVRLAERVGELIGFWGFSPHTGRIWTLCYLSEDPIGAADGGQDAGVGGSATRRGRL